MISGVVGDIAHTEDGAIMAAVVLKQIS